MVSLLDFLVPFILGDSLHRDMWEGFTSSRSEVSIRVQPSTAKQNLKGHERLDLKQTFAFEGSAIYHYNILHVMFHNRNHTTPLFQQTFPRSTFCPPCRTAEVQTLSSVSGLTRFDWTVFELHWQLWRHFFHHWGHHDPFHVR